MAVVLLMNNFSSLENFLKDDKGDVNIPLSITFKGSTNTFTWKRPQTVGGSMMLYSHNVMALGFLATVVMTAGVNNHNLWFEPKST